MNHSWLWWFILAVALFVVEIVNATFYVICIAMGALTVSLVAFFFPQGGLELQLAVFAVATFLSFLAVRPFAERFRQRSKKFRTNVESLVSAVALVTKEIGPGIKPGRVSVRGESWRAVSLTGATLPKDDEVRIIRVEGVNLLVKSIHHEGEFK